MDKQYLIAHRGNIDGINSDWENEPSYIDNAIAKGFDVEVDVWLVKNKIYLGHDEPQYDVTLDFLWERKDSSWYHAKNFEALEFLLDVQELHTFWHQEDTYTITSKGVIWQYPSEIVYPNAIFLMPEKFPNVDKEELKNALGVCSDFISSY